MQNQLAALATRALENPLSPDELTLTDAYWRAANYLSVGQIYLLANPLLKEPLKLAHIKPRLLGHWGTTPGLTFCLCPFQSRDQEIRLERDLHRRPWTWRTRRDCECLSGGYVFGTVPEYSAK